MIRQYRARDSPALDGLRPLGRCSSKDGRRAAPTLLSLYSRSADTLRLERRPRRQPIPRTIRMGGAADRRGARRSALCVVPESIAIAEERRQRPSETESRQTKTKTTTAEAMAIVEQVTQATSRAARSSCRARGGQDAWTGCAPSASSAAPLAAARSRKTRPCCTNRTILIRPSPVDTRAPSGPAPPPCRRPGISLTCCGRIPCGSAREEVTCGCAQFCGRLALVAALGIAPTRAQSNPFLGAWNLTGDPPKTTSTGWRSRRRRASSARCSSTAAAARSRSRTSRSPTAPSPSCFPPARSRSSPSRRPAAS